MSTSDFVANNPGNIPEASLELWVEPADTWRSGTLLAFYRSGNPHQFSLRQFYEELVLSVAADEAEQIDRKPVELEFRRVFQKQKRVFLTITSGTLGVCIYLDGAIVASVPSFPLGAQEFSGRLVLGDSPGQSDAWSGQILGVALYQRKLTPTQVFHNYATWTQNGRPDPAPDEHIIALYLFDERTGNMVRNKVNSTLDLTIPNDYKVMDKMVMEPFWAEYQTSRDYWGSALKNVVGFLPFGFCFYAYLITREPLRRATALTVAIGAATSLMIEVLQAFLPTRASGTTDLITNTLGTFIGALTYRLMVPALARFFPAISIVERERAHDIS